jgi:hypothetical protein
MATRTCIVSVSRSYKQRQKAEAQESNRKVSHWTLPPLPRSFGIKDLATVFSQIFEE